MEKIFISHATKDEKLAADIMDFLQNQYGLTRKHFFLTSDEEFDTGDKWIDIIEKEMNNAKIILPIITAEYLESHFCLCELGAAWINRSSILPVVLHSKNQRALESTPYRSVFQVLTLSSADDLMALGDAFADKGGYQKPKIISLKKRATSLWDNTIQKYLIEMNNKVVVTPEEVAKLRKELSEAQAAYEEADDKVLALEKEIKEIRNLKDAEELKEYDYAQLEEWEELETALDDVTKKLNKISPILTTVIYYYYADQDDRFFGGHENLNEFKKEERAGRIRWEDGWLVDDDDPSMANIINEIDNLKEIMDGFYNNEVMMNRFNEEYPGIRFDLKYTPFWEKVLKQTIYDPN